MTKQTSQQTFKTLVTACALLSVLVFFVSLGANERTTVQLAAVTSADDVGKKIGSIVHDVVRNIKAHDPDSLITHAHVLAVMCQEMPSLQIQGGNSEGRQEGLMQVITSTYTGLVLGQIAAGKCRYVAALENSECANLSARTQNTRCSIEVGACLFNYNLLQCKGDTACAYNAYNTGSTQRRANGASDFAAGYNNLIQGNACAKSSHNTGVWASIMSEVSRLTGGTFKTDEATHIPISANNLKTLGNPIASIFSGIGLSGNAQNGGVNPIARLLGVGGSSVSSSGGNTTNTNTGSDVSSVGSADNTNNTEDTQVTFRTIDALLAGTDDSDTDQAIADLLNGGVGGSSSGTTHTASATTTQTILGKSPTLLCLPNPLLPGEEAIILWACRDEAYTTQGENLDTAGAIIGSVRVSPQKTTTYTVECINDQDDVYTASSCELEVVEPVLAVVATPSTVPAGSSVTLSWEARSVSSCILTSPDIPAFERQGVSGDAVSPILGHTSTFVLTCETATGVIEDRHIEVSVQ